MGSASARKVFPPAPQRSQASIVAQIAVEAVYNALVEYGPDSYSGSDVDAVLAFGTENGCPDFYLNLLNEQAASVRD